MADRNIRKEVKKKKKPASSRASLGSAVLKAPVSEPEVIKKKKKTDDWGTA